ncbi:D-alanyl-D-alanine carboxypeptidase family protein [Fodinicola acaciae]|uniref:D-alanyl-D-alanine carboxypeptidase family protein n=1 Tax=Fodinicola acaciae TaxID=2681555 RepID=UPI0013CFF752|nr:serine hydrolase [Fodinicola acaciae]
MRAYGAVTFLIAVVLAALSVPPAAQAETPPPVPCPVAKASPPIAKHPPAPVPPPRAPSTVGGDQLGSAGLVMPPDGGALPAGLSATSWVVADLDTGVVLAACGPHERHPPASCIKLLTIGTVLPKLGDPLQMVTATAQDTDIEPGSSAAGLVTGGKYRLQTVLLGLLLVSGNDAAMMLARLAGGPGGVPATLSDMNAYAHQLGALDTTARTPHGLDAAGQFSSAYDLALIARADFDRADFRALTATRTAQIPTEVVTEHGKPKSYPGYQIQNDNKLLRNYHGALGGKTGYTDVARHTFVGVAERGGHRLVVTLMNGEQRPVPMWQQGARLLDWGFAHQSSKGVGTLVTRASATPSTPADHRAARQLAEQPSGSLPALIAGSLLVVTVAAAGGLFWLLRRSSRRRS